MDEYKEEKCDKSLVFTVPGSLQVFIEDSPGVTKQLDNLDGFRIDHENNDLHYIQYNGRFWEKMVLKDVKLKAMRAVRDCPTRSNSHIIEFCYLPSLEKPFLSGVRIISSYNDDNIEDIHYEIGTVSGDNIFRERRYYNAGLKKLSDIVKICEDELVYMLETTGLETKNIQKMLKNINLLGENA